MLITTLFSRLGSKLFPGVFAVYGFGHSHHSSHGSICGHVTDGAAAKGYLCRYAITTERGVFLKPNLVN
jgi:hypothetical protein